jgi:hypothetical protein
VFGDVEHGHAAALGGGEVVHGIGPCSCIRFYSAETGFSKR